MIKKNKKWKVEFAPGFIKDCERLFSTNPIYSIPRWFDNMKYEIKWAWQRVFRGFDDRWYWNLDINLSWIIPKCVRHIKKYGMGCPGKLYDKKRKNNECYKWKEILEKIAKGFEAVEKIQNNHFWKGRKFEKLDKQYKEGMRLFVKYFRNLWD